MELKTSGGTTDVPYTSIDKGRAYVPELCLLWGDEIVSAEYEDRVATVVHSPINDVVILFTEIEGGTAQDLHRNKNVVPSNPDHEFSLQGFPHGVTIHAWTNEGFPSEEQVQEAMDEQAKLNRNLEEQVMETMAEEERAAYRQQMGRHAEFPRRILQGVDVEKGETHGVRWCYAREDDWLHGGFEVPSAIIYEYLDGFGWQQWETGHSRIIGGTHFIEVDFQEATDEGMEVVGSDELVETHLRMWAMMVAELTRTAKMVEKSGNL